MKDKAFNIQRVVASFSHAVSIVYIAKILILSSSLEFCFYWPNDLHFRTEVEEVTIDSTGSWKPVSVKMEKQDDDLSGGKRFCLHSFG